MPASVRTFAATFAAILVTTGATAQGVGGDAEPDIYTRLKAVQTYLEDGSAIMMAQACAETIPDFMSEFLPKFVDWRSSNSKQISLGAALSTQFKDPNGQPMDPSTLGRAAAEKVRAIGPDERRRECDKLLRDVSPPG